MQLARSDDFLYIFYLAVNKLIRNKKQTTNQSTAVEFFYDLFYNGYGFSSLMVRVTQGQFLLHWLSFWDTEKLMRDLHFFSLSCTAWKK